MLTFKESVSLTKTWSDSIVFLGLVVKMSLFTVTSSSFRSDIVKPIYQRPRVIFAQIKSRETRKRESGMGKVEGCISC